MNNKIDFLYDEIDRAFSESCHYSVFKMREVFRRRFSFAVPTLEAVQKIKDFVGNDIVLEINAGKGLWAYLLRQLGVKIIPTDIGHMLQECTFDNDRDTFLPIVCCDSEAAVDCFPEATVLMTVWPDYKDPAAALALRKFKGNKVVYIGECCGCTADQDFHELLSFWEREEVEIPNWFAIHDSVYLCKR